ncbi:hypothetical protein ABZW18_03500 [Streptomyces sp. NPDC004647]|uniref:hypothetical protein n=1 Tax=Streptomyces sp. NPDC004647 TaxID=3154671 RepID=UPI00339F02BE
MNDFDRIFDPQYSAADLFTNRDAENQAFERGLLRHLERLLDGGSVLARTARENVLTFYGIGGIGKTELSRRLERWILGELGDPGDWGDAPRLDQPVRTVRVDFHGSTVVGAADIVLCLRAAVADLGGRFPAFDLGLAAWWALARPGTVLPDLRSAGGFDVREQITDTLNEVLADAGARLGVGPLTVRTGIRLVDAVRTRRLRSRTLRECAPLAAVIEQARLDPSPYVAATLAGLLSWDLERLEIGERPVVVAFADAAEYIQGGDRIQERLFNRIVHLTPGVLWVVTSRKSLDWDAGALTGVLPASGPQVWPGLRLGERAEPHQHLVGDLSDADVDRYLAAASGTAGNPHLGTEVIDRIRRGAHGLPLYLDLSMSIARAAADSPLDPVAFGGSLPELVTRVFADLPENEREIARTASLIPRFDPDLMARVTGGLLGDAQRFCRRSLVSEDNHPVFPFRLHDAVRSAIANESVIHRGAWAPTDRTARADTLVETLRQLHEDVLDNVGQRLDVLELVAGLCAAHDMRAPWLLKALIDLPGMRQTAERLPPPAEDNWMGQLSRFFEGWRGRTARQRIDYLERLLTGPLPDDVHRVARRFLAYAHRTTGKSDLALPILLELLSEKPKSGRVRYQVARTLHTLGRYEALSEHLDRYPLDPGADLRIQGDLAHDRGEMAEGIAGPAGRAGYLRSVGQHRVSLENDAIALWRAALVGRTTVAECDAAIAEADRYGMWLNMRTALAAKVLCLAADDHDADGVLTEVTAVVNASSGFRGWREWTSGLLLGLRRDDHRRIAEIREEWDRAARSWTPNYQVVDRLFIFAGYPPTYPPSWMSGIGRSLSDIDRRWHEAIGAFVNRASTLS